jgi:hypothetical protein
MQTLPAVLVLCLILLCGAAALVRLPIHRHSTSSAEKAITTPSILKKVVKASHQFPHQLPFDIDTNFDANKVLDSIEFSFNMTIGTPPQHFSVVFDTGGFETCDFWVPSVACDPLYVQCKGHRQYDHRKSTTYNTSGDSFMTDLDTTGLLTSDVMNFGPLQIKLQKFGEAWNFPSPDANWHADGYYGFNPLKHMDTGLTPFYTMVEQGVLPEPVVGMYIVRTNTSLGGELLLGGRDSSRYQGQLAYLNFTAADSLVGWMVKMDSVKVPSINQSFCVGCKAVLHNQDAYSIGKYPDAEKLNVALGAIIYRVGFYLDYFRFNCKKVSSLPQVVFAIAGKEFVIGPERYVLKVTAPDGETVCISSFIGDRFESMDYDWSLGTAFFETAYVEFNLQLNQVGLALSAN